jgi:hypothetical protein
MSTSWSRLASISSVPKLAGEAVAEARALLDMAPGSPGPFPPDPGALVEA